MADPYRHAAPTADAPAANRAGAEGAYDPHNMQWTRGAPPIDCKVYSTFASPAVDLVAESVTRKTDDKGDGTGNGRRASGLLALDAGTAVFKTGAGGGGNSVTVALQAGQGFDIEMTELTSWSGSQLVVFW